MINDSQILLALLFALVSAILAIRLGTDLYQ
jgi:photosystem I reaction center subunit XII|uniref:Photosystem I reaction center subunit XII n=2 Tax=Ceramiaceae TaxID=31377 RepID=A0A1C9CDB9_CERJP|nr:photosystem I subunit XII [Ceramium japonicum]AOM66379.1 photosystem I subunit XII [Ceramium japonicum]QCI06827.1 photosystem I reaction center subunit M [Gayliella sp.]